MEGSALAKDTADLKQTYKTCEDKVTSHQNRSWAQITLFQLVYSMINTGMALCILPQEADRLNAGTGSVWVGIYLGVSGATQLICPLAGKLSDRHASEFGRRRPFIVGGTVATILSFSLLREASKSVWPMTYVFALLIAQLSLNFAFAAQCGLPADLYSPGGRSSKVQEERDTAGRVSAFVAMHSFLGSLFAVMVILVTEKMEVYVQYDCYMLMLMVGCSVVCMAAQEESTANELREPITLREVVSSFMLDISKDFDFFWVCVGRVFYYVSTSASVFLLYYIRDMVEVSDPTEIRSKLATLIIVAQLVGAGVSVPAGDASNAFGRKPVIYTACAIMSTTFLLYVAAPLMPIDYRWYLVLCSGLCYGLGSGIYLSVDYALALDCLPVGKTTAEAFGLWGIAGFVGSTAGPLVGGFMLSTNLKEDGTVDQTGPNEDAHYTYMGYMTVMLGLGVFMNAFVILATNFIQGTR
mmetsp:Transcript_69648/g.123305  ORF Transcript_69648/g.123305 Transcript_69648/m.123305 type:complete len:468 (-) Transcript_69648:160-1563(-)